MLTKTHLRRRAGTLSVLTFLAAISGNALAGDLNPPSGAVAPTMKTLDQVEARTPIPGGLNQPKFTISQPGSYYLTGNRVHNQGQVGASIQVMVSDVTIDLNGFSITVTNPGGAQYAIMDRGDDGSLGISGVTIRNGVVSGPGYDDGGINLAYTFGARVENVTARGISGGTGISVGEGGLVVDSNAVFCKIGFGGDRASFLRCAADRSFDTGFSLFRSSAKDCVARNNFIYGFLANYRSVVESCVATDSNTGIFAAGDGCRIDSNTVSGSFFGVLLANVATNTIVTRNSVRKGNGPAFAMDQQVSGNFPNNHVAQIITDPTNLFTSTNPWANFSH